ncbi:HNH endonuclease signature motif containing protein [Agreia sp. Leaf244]|uniref:HNH endonuclease signature motif containing protein n=1 Tax=Agreia sp. Leaf244 TaxID=1736305 RepID=UPI0012F7B21C|nr:HNH endonuclease signature motif containing protein [Agreia sp. Leaf244]
MVNRTGWSDATDRAERHLVAAAMATIADAAIDANTDTDADADAGADAGLDEGGGTGDVDALWRVPRRYTVEEIGRLVIRIREHLDPDGAQPRDAVKQSLRGFSYPKVGADGMARGRYALPPLQLGVFLAAVDSILSPRTPDTPNPPPRTASQEVTDFGHAGAGITGNQSIFGDQADGGLASDGLSPHEPASQDDTTGDEAVIDSRTAEQKLLDAVMTLLELAATSPTASLLNGAAPTVNVHVTLDDLQSGHGAAWIDGTSEPIPISTVDQLRCHGDTITTLFGQHGEVLHHGKTKRLATRRQRRALAARDGGCVIPGCTAPPSRCQAHHVTPWVSEDYPPGRTDIDNLALLCPFHHATIHTSAWQLVMIHGRPHVRPPSWQDPNRSPRPAGHQRTGRPW